MVRWACLVVDVGTEGTDAVGGVCHQDARDVDTSVCGDLGFDGCNLGSRWWAARPSWTRCCRTSSCDGHDM